MINKISSQFIAILISGSVYVSAQHLDLKFDPLTVDEGLSQTTANAILQDKYGFMWFGTQDGLNRYDGYNFKIFTHETGNKNSLSNNYIWALHEDNEGIIWIGSFGGGLTRFDPVTESFTHYKHNDEDKNSLSDNHIFSISEYPEGTLWLRTGNGINKFNKENGTTQQYLSGYINTLTIQSPDYIWAGVGSQLIRIDINTEEIKYFSSYPKESDLKFGGVSNLFADKDNLFVSCNAGLVRINFKSNTSSLIPVPNIINGKKAAFNHLLIEGDYFLIGTSDGLIVYNKKNKTQSFYVNDPNKPNSLTHNNIVSLYKSKEGIIWIGTYGGINRINKLKQDFTLLQNDPDDKNSLSNRSVSPVIEDKQGIVWIGTPTGLNAYNRSTNENIIFRNLPGKSNSLNSNYILSLFEDSEGNIWVGTRGSSSTVNKFNYKDIDDLNKISFERIKTYNGGTGSGRIQSIYEDSKGYIWMGTSNGLARLNRDKQLINYPTVLDGTGPSHSFIYCIYEDSKGNLWFGTPTGGLNIFNRETEKFLYIKHNDDNPNSLSNDIVLSIFEDSKNQLWLATSGGLNKLDTPLEKEMFDKIKDSSITISFTQYGRADGLPNDVIYGILEDKNGFLWFSTNKGLVKFDPSSDNPVIKAFDANDGLQNNEFNQNSYFKNEKGEMFFGGIGGLNIFHPDSIKLNSYKPPVVFTDFKLFNESVPIKHNDKYSLEKSIINTKEINLLYDHDVISFEFAALNYINPQKNMYAYMMEGFDDKWIYAGNQRFVTYTNLNPGNYTFKVKASNNDGIWNEQGSAIKLYIPPPPWLSWYAFVIYSLLFISSIFLFIRYRINSVRKELEMKVKIEQAKIEEREEVRRKSSADFHDEAGNKITKISLFTELSKNEANNPSVKEYLNKIEENVKELSAGMRDFIWVLDPNKDTLYDTIDRLYDFGNSMFGYTNINLHLKGLKTEMKNVILSMDCRRALMLIFKEAMNNCLKYSSAENIEMIVELNGELIEIALKDDGKGFDINETSNGYGLNNMKERAKKIGCNLVINSTNGCGTKIIFKGNITHMGN